MLILAESLLFVEKCAKKVKIRDLPSPLTRGETGGILMDNDESREKVI